MLFPGIIPGIFISWNYLVNRVHTGISPWGSRWRHFFFCFGFTGRPQTTSRRIHPKSPAASPRSWGLASVEAAGSLPSSFYWSLPSKSPERRHLLITPPLPCFHLCCHKLVSLRWCAGLMLMRANKMAFYGAWFANRPANQKFLFQIFLVWTQNPRNYRNYSWEKYSGVKAPYDI